MASTRKRVNKNGSVVYEIRVTRGYDENHKQLKPYQTTWKAPEGWSKKSIEKELIKISAEFERDCREGKVLTKEEQIRDEQLKREQLQRQIIEEEQKITFSKYVAMFLKSRTALYSNNTLVNYKRVLKDASVLFGSIKLSDVRSVDIKNYITDLQVSGKKTNQNKPLAYRTVLKYHIVLHALFQAAVEDEVIEVSPMDRLKRPKPRKDENINAKKKSYTLEEVQQILSALSDEPLKWQVLVRFLLDSGCRRGEAIGLKWENIDFSTGKSEIINNAQYTAEKGVYITTPKSGKGRVIYLTAPMISLLSKWKRTQSLLFFQQGLPQSSFVFTHEDGKPMNPQAPTAYLKTLGNKCGIPTLHPHALRHTMASLAITNGIDVVTISKKLGHSEVSTTLNIYAHENEEAMKKASETYSEILYGERKA